MSVIQHAASVLRSFDIEPKPLDRLIEAYFRRHREISSSERRSISECVFGVARWRRRLDGWLAVRGINPSTPRPCGRGMLRAERPDHESRCVCFLAWKEPVNVMPRGFPGGEAAFYSFPDFLYEKMLRAYGRDGAASIARILNEPQRPVLRANVLKAGREEVAEKLMASGIETEATKRSPYGLRLFKRAKFDDSAVFREGLFDVQDESSQLAVIVADPKPGETLLDACAGAGGKSLMAAMLMRNSGLVVAADPDEMKLKELKRRQKRTGASIIEALSTKELKKRAPSKGNCDLVIIDAPCSGSGTIRRNPDLKWRLTGDMIAERVLMQRKLLKEYSEWVRPGGRVAYMTCSILPEENEEVVGDFLKKDGFEIVDVRVLLKERGIVSEGITTEEGYLKTDPRKGDWDGFFAAVLKRVG